MSNPRNIFIKKVLETSQSGDFEIAMSEWVCLGKKTNLDNDFYSNCDLCGAAIYKTNYIICNVKTMRIHSIGCECIKRFKSSYPSELVSKLKKSYLQNQLQHKLIGQYHKICNQGIPDPILFKSFRMRLIRLIKSYGKMNMFITEEGAKEILSNILKKKTYSSSEVKRIRLLVKDPSKARKIYVKTQWKKRKLDKYGIVIN